LIVERRTKELEVGTSQLRFHAYANVLQTPDAVSTICHCVEKVKIHMCFGMYNTSASLVSVILSCDSADEKEAWDWFCNINIFRPTRCLFPTHEAMNMVIRSRS
jgi:hypothetical protein